MHFGLSNKLICTNFNKLLKFIKVWYCFFLEKTRIYLKKYLFLLRKNAKTILCLQIY